MAKPQAATPALPQLWDRDAAAVTRNPEPSLSRGAALHAVGSGSTPAISTTGTKGLPGAGREGVLNHHSNTLQAHLSLAVPAGHKETPRERQGQQSTFMPCF